jgi:hypothetical protein
MGWTHGRKWTDKLIETKIREVMKALNINRMPTRTEIEMVMKNSSLTNKISKGLGYYGWAKKLGLPIKESETTLGKRYEFKAMKDIQQNTGLSAEKMPQNFPYDILVNNFIRVDVKASNRYYYDGKGFYYTFNLQKKHPVCDIMMCYCIDDDQQIEKLLIIPSTELHTTQISVGSKSKYDIYNNAWHIFKQYSEFYSKTCC